MPPNQTAIEETPEVDLGFLNDIPDAPASQVDFVGPVQDQSSTQPQDIAGDSNLVEPTTISDTTIREDVIPEIDTKIDTLAETGQFVDNNGNLRDADGTIADDTQATTDEITALDESIEQDDNEIQGILDDLKTQLDADTASQIKSIEASFGAREVELKEINRRNEAATDTALLLGGSSRFTQSGDDLSAAQARAGVMEIAQLNALEASAIAEVKAAQAAQDYELASIQIGLIENLRAEKIEKATKLAEDLAEKNNELRERAKTQADEQAIADVLDTGITDPAGIFSALNGEVSFDDILEITGGISEATPDLKFVSGTKHQSSGFFDPKTGKFTKIGIGGGSDRGGSTSGGAGQISASAQAWVDNLKSGKAKFSDVPSALKNEVAVGLANDSGSSGPTLAQTRSVDQSNIAIANIDKALGFLEDEGFTDFGTANSPLGRIVGQILPGSEARDLDASLSTVNALIGFDALEKMRLASPTGGALGQVSERELTFLQSVQGSLDVGQSTAQLTKTLNDIRDSFARVRAINSPNTTESEYRSQFPDATEDEIAELKDRFNIFDYSRVSNTVLLNPDFEEDEDPNNIYD